MVDLYSTLSLQNSLKLTLDMDAYCSDISTETIARLEDALMSKQKSFKTLIRGRSYYATILRGLGKIDVS